MARILSLVICAIAAYLIGSANGAIISSKYFFHKDIRQYGSGNAGLTNFYRVFGKTGALLVIAIDIGKTVLAVYVGALVYRHFGGDLKTGELFFGFCTMLGHVFPVFYRFRGGKAVLAAGTLVMIFDWRIGLIVLAIFALIVLIFRYVSLGSIIGGAAFPIFTIIFGHPIMCIILSFMCAALMIGRHSENMYRLAKGKESRFYY